MIELRETMLRQYIELTLLSCSFQCALPVLDLLRSFLVGIRVCSIELTGHLLRFVGFVSCVIADIGSPFLIEEIP